MKKTRTYALSEILGCFLLLFVFVFFAGCGAASDPEETEGAEDEAEDMVQSTAAYCDIPDGVETYDGAEVYLEGERLPLYSVQVNTSRVWVANLYTRTPCGVGLFELKGKVNVTVKVKGELGYSSKVRPLSAGIVPIADPDEGTLSFTISSAGNYSVEINGDPLDAIHLFVTEYKEDKQKEMDALSEGKELVYFGPGLHTAENDERINSSNVVNLGSDTLVYIDDGAVVRAKFLANNCENITVAGRGVIDGSTFDRNANAGTVTVPLEFNNCSNVTLSEFSVLDPAGWCVNFYFIDGGRIDGVKIITSRSNGDGISLQSCKNIDVDGCFVRAWDDALVVKNYPVWSDRSVYGETRDITFTNCVIWSDLAQCMEIGYETVGEVMQGITFENITVVHAFHKPVISIHNGNNAEIQNILWKDITVEDASPTESTLIEIQNVYSDTWSSQHATTPLGSIDGVEITNVEVLSGDHALTSDISGWHDTREGYEGAHYVRNVTLSHITYRGENFSSAVDLEIGNYVEDVEIIDGEATGAAFVAKMTEETLSSYTDAAVIERNRQR